MITKGLLFTLLLICFTSVGQSFDLEFPTTEKSIALGDHTTFTGEITLNNGSAANFDMHVFNVAFPMGWSYVLCTPDVCLNEKTDDYSINFDYDTLTSISNTVKIQVITSTDVMDTLGTFNVALVDTDTGDSISFELIVNIDGILSLEKLENNSAISVIQLNDEMVVSHPSSRIADFQIYDFAGKLIHAKQNIRKTQYRVSMLSYTAGIYLFICTDELGNRTAVRKYVTR